MFAAGVERVGNLAANALLDAYALENLDQSETLIGAAAALAAEFALRAVHTDLPDAKSPVPPAIGATLALEIMVGVSRMAPLQREIT